MTTLEIKNIAAIHELIIDLPDNSGGVMVFKGRNRAGKSTAIEIVRSLLAKSGKLRASDGADRGSVSGFGVDASVSQRTTYRGEAEVATLEGRFDFSDLVLPQAKEPETRDRIRIKALLSLTGAKAEPSLFYALTKGDRDAFEKVVTVADLKTTDIVDMGARVKRAFEGAARKKEADAEHAEGHAAACKEQAAGVDPNTKVDLDELHQKSAKATAEHAALVEKKEAADRNFEAVQAAERRLEEAKASYDGPVVAEATVALDEASENLTGLQREMDELTEKMRLLNARITTAEKHRDNCKSAREAAIAHQKLLEEIQQTILTAQGGDDPPSDLEIDLAQRRVDKAKAEVEWAVRLRDAIKKAEEAKTHQDAARKHTAEAEALRAAAQTVDQLLTTKLPEGPLRAESGRLVLDTERGEGVPFDECSQGEKYRVALPYGIQSVGPGGYLALVQEGWDGLDHQYRTEIAEMCRESRVWLITGEVDEGELRAEEFSLEA